MILHWLACAHWVSFTCGTETDRVRLNSVQDNKTENCYTSSLHHSAVLVFFPSKKTNRDIEKDTQASIIHNVTSLVASRRAQVPLRLPRLLIILSVTFHESFNPITLKGRFTFFSVLKIFSVFGNHSPFVLMVLSFWLMPSN